MRNKFIEALVILRKFCEHNYDKRKCAECCVNHLCNKYLIGYPCDWIIPNGRLSWPKQELFSDGFGGARVGYTCPYCKQVVPYAGKYCGNCGERVYGGEE